MSINAEKPATYSPKLVEFERLLDAELDAEEAAALLKIHPKTLQRMARQGKLPAHPFGDGQRKRWRFLLTELDAWMRSRNNEFATRAA
jgi:excisionase family DNA binding protein